MDSRFYLLTQGISRVAILSNPAMMDRELEGASPDDMWNIFQMLKDVEQNTWIFQVIALGKIYESMPEEARTIARAGQAMRIAQHLASRLYRVYLEIIRKRIDEQGDASVFPLRDVGFYVTAVDKAASVGRTPMELIEYAESMKIENPTYTHRQFREDLMSSGTSKKLTSVSSLAKGVASICKVDEEDVSSFSQYTEEKAKWVEKIERAAGILQQAESALRSKMEEEAKVGQIAEEEI